MTLDMPKVGASSDRKYYYEEFGCSALSPHEAELFGKMCEQSVTKEKHSVPQHTGRTKQKPAGGARTTGEQSTTNTAATGGQSQPGLDECTAFVDANIPLWRAGNYSPESFLAKNIGQNAPSRAAPRKTYVDTYVGVFQKAKDEVTQKIWTSGAERTDAVGRRLAERKKNEGNEYYKNKEYREALKLYTQAIDLCPDCAAYYSNRSACYMMLGKYYEALNDAREAVRLDTSFVKGYLRVAKCNIALGDATAALSVLRQAGEIEPNNRAIQEEVTKAQSLIRCQDEVAKATAKADYRTAIFHLDRALELAVGCRSLKITKAEYLVFLQRYGDAQEIVNDILQYDSGNADAIYVRGMCLYYQDNPDAAFSHFQHVLRLAPDHQKARDVYKKAKLLKQKKEEGNEAFKKGNYQEAFNLYTDALAIDPLNKHTNAKLYFNRATVGSKLNKLEQATEDCTAAINLDDGYVKAYLRRAKCYQLLEKHEEAVRDYERITKLDRSQEHKRLLQEAKIQLKRSKRKDYYKILGVNKNASDDEIKKSYRKMALVHHPDRHANASEKDKHEHEIKFKEIGEAYSVLTDAKKRAMYDRGQDINDPDGGFAHEADIDPNQIFQAFFGGGHGGYSFGGHTAGFQQGGFPGTGFTGASFPGGFHFQFG